MKQPRFLLLAGGGGVLTWLLLGPAGRVLTDSPVLLPLANDSIVSFRVRFGLTDGEPRSWDGSLSVSGGKLLGLRLWRPHPEDRLEGAAWKLATRAGMNFQKRPWEPELTSPPQPYVNPTGIIVDVQGGSGMRVRFATSQGNFEVRPFDLAPGVAQRFLNGGAIADRVPSAQSISSRDFQNDFATLAALPNGQVWVAWIAYANWRNQVMARRYTGSAWEEPVKISETHDDIFLVKAGRDGKGGLWLVWSARVNENWDLYGRRFDGASWSAIERLTQAPQPDLFPALATDAAGNLWLAWQGFRNGKSDIFARRFDGASWSQEERISESPANDWEPAIAADSKGRVWVAWDTYDQGNYDVVARKHEGGQWGEVIPVAASPKFEAHVSLACDARDRLWAAWNEGGTQWGKDTGFLLNRQGTRLYQDRWLALAVFDGASWQEPPDVEEALPAELRHYNDVPQLAHDGKGRVWLAFRHRRPRILDTPSDTPMHRAAWELYLTALEGDRWLDPIAVPFSQGRTDMRSGLVSDGAGNLYLAWPMDNRDYAEFLFQRADVYAARVPPLRKPPQEARLKRRVVGEIPTFPLHPKEPQDLARIRGYEIRAGGKTYRIYRGDTHRHTEFSMDGNNDGSLIDTYRYAIDAASLDFLMVSEHNGSAGPDIDYINWLLQQMADALEVRGRFLPLFGYERSLPYPNGHRNVIFARRGNPTLPIPPEEMKAQTGAQALYEYLRKYDGIAISHTSATGMGTDWRDNDPQVEPLVEIYQGDRVSAEYEGAPKAAWGGKLTGAPGGFRPAGFVWNAWAKGYKLGVQASSDHLSTHISYACTIAEEFTRQGLLAAMKQRHSYGATDNIILDYRLHTREGAEHLQGDIVTTGSGFSLWVKAIGTAPIRQIDIIKNNTFVHTSQPMQQEVEFTFNDARAADRAENYYYVRLIQADDQMAWSSPIWVTVK
jgi:hypothetical protein